MPADNVLPFRRRYGRNGVVRHRVRTQWRGVLELDEEGRACLVADLSALGARLSLAPAPDPGRRVALRLAGKDPIPAQVAWRREQQVGLRFLVEQPWIGALEARCPLAWSR